MTIENDILHIKYDINSLRARPLSKGRPWLYFMVFVGLISTIDNSNQLTKISDNLENKIQTSNILGDTIPEKYYVVGRDTAIVEYDGKPVLDYFNKK